MHILLIASFLAWPVDTDLKEKVPASSATRLVSEPASKYFRIALGIPL